MKQCLADVNVWLALLVKDHEHHVVAHAWFESLQSAEAGFCRPIQLSVVRLLSHKAVMRDAVLTATDGWNLLDRLCQDQRVEFLPEPPGIELIIPSLFRYAVPTPQLVADA